MAKPQYRLRVGDTRVFYDVRDEAVEVLAIVAKRQAQAWLAGRGTPEPESALAKVKDDFSRYLRLASEDEVVITRHGRPAGVLIGFASEDDWIDYQIENHPEFLERVAGARKALREGRGVPLEDL